MKNTDLPTWLPGKPYNALGDYRRVGVEFELAGVAPDELIGALTDCFGGKVKANSAVEFAIEDTELGNFKIELDATALKDLNDKQLPDNDVIAGKLVELITKAAEQIVPWEIVSPPIPVNKLHLLSHLVDKLRERGAKGTRYAPHYAFGLHLNPELPDLEPETIVNYLRAFFCLYDWIVFKEQTDTTRKITSYVKHFSREYQLLVLDANYSPTLTELIDDYLLHNPTRNRSLDMLPLFAFLDEARVKAGVDDERIQKRPTFHYRLPNCDIDNPGWNVSSPWKLWLTVETLAGMPDTLARLAADFSTELSRLTFPLENRWKDLIPAIAPELEL